GHPGDLTETDRGAVGKGQDPLRERLGVGQGRVCGRRAVGGELVAPRGEVGPGEDSPRVHAPVDVVPVDPRGARVDLDDYVLMVAFARGLRTDPHPRYPGEGPAVGGVVAPVDRD